MLERKELKKLVAIMISSSPSPPTAIELYHQVRVDRQLIQHERVRSFKSFVRIINSFPEVVPVGNSPCFYKLKK